MIKKGSWVSISKIILEPSERAKGIPEDTAATPLRMWVCGFLENDADVGSEAVIRTKMNRLERGILEEVNPTSKVSYGDFVPEILQISVEARKMLHGGGSGE